MKLKSKQFIDSFIGIPLTYINLVFAKLLGAILHRNHSLEKAPRHILFIKLLGFGSVILASDAIWSIKKKFPESKISIICSSGIFEGIESLKLFDRILVIDDRSLFTMIRSSVSILLHTWSLKNKWVIDLEVYSKLTSIFSLWTCANNRIGFYFSTVAFRYRLNTHNVYFNTLSHVEENYNRIAALLKIDPLSKFIIPGFEHSRNYQNLKIIAVNNTCSDLSLERKMKENQVKEICKWILLNTGFDIVLLGAPTDYETNEGFINKYFESEPRIQNIAGKYKFSDYYIFLHQHCFLMVTIDSAPLHIANKLNIPNVSVWGPTSPEIIINLNAENEVVYLKVSCSPCTHFTDILPCGGDNFCIKNIVVDEICAKINKIVNTFTPK